MSTIREVLDCSEEGKDYIVLKGEQKKEFAYINNVITKDNNLDSCEITFVDEFSSDKEAEIKADELLESNILSFIDSDFTNQVYIYIE